MDFGAYARVLRTPHAVPFVAAGALSRFPRSTLSLGVILLVADTFDSYTAAGLTTGVLVAGMAIAAPFWSARMDRLGQRRVLAAALAALLVSVSLLAALALAGAPLSLWLGAAALVGLSTPDIPSAVRARWTSLVFGQARTTAFAVETIVDQTVFVTGPPIVTIVAAAVDPLLGLAFSMVLGVGGGIWLLLQSASEPPVVEVVRTGRVRLVPPPGILPIALACMGVGAMFGAFDVSAVAWAEAAGRPWLAGVAMALFALGIGVGAVLVGARQWRMPLNMRFLLFLAVGAAGVALLPLTSATPLMLAVLVVSGLLVSPVPISGIALVAARAPRDRVTESLAYPTAGMSIGLPLGATGAGSALDSAGAAAGFATCAIALGVGFAIAAGGELVRVRRLAAAPPADRPAA